MRKPKNLVIAAALLPFAATTAWALHRVWPPAVDDASARIPPREARSRPAAVNGVLGQQRRLTLHLAVELEQPGHEKPLAVTLEGDWVTTLVAARDGERDVACEVVGARVSGRGVAQASASDVEALAQRLSRRFWVTYRADGAVLRVHFPRGLAPSDQNLLQMIVTETELMRPATDAPQWTAMERDGAGSYLAVYQRPLDDPGQLVKRKVKYVDIDGTGEPTHSLAVEISASEWRFTLDAAGVVTALEGMDRLRISMPMAPMNSDGSAPSASHLDIRADVHLSDARAGNAPDLVGSLERARQDVKSAPVGTHAGDREQAIAARDQRLLEGHTATALLTSARARAQDALLPARLAALFRRQPDAIAAGIEVVRASGGRALVTNALASAGTAPALGALSTLAHDQGAPRQARVDALNALIGLAHPSSSEIGVATDLLDDPDREVRRTARMVCGALAFAMRVSNPTTQAAIEQALLARYPGATASERADLLDGLGNSGGTTAFAAAERALGDDHADVRRAAVSALRRVDGAVADRKLAEVLPADRDERVRMAAIDAAGVRWPDRRTTVPRRADDPLVLSLLRAASADRSEAVRAGAVGLLRRHQDTGLEIPTALAHIAAHDPSPGVRRLASELLASAPAPR